MDHSRIVKRFNGLADRFDHGCNVFPSPDATSDSLSQRSPVSVRHHEKRTAIVSLINVEDANDPGNRRFSLDSTKEDCLRPKALTHIEVVAPVLGQDLDGHGGIKSWVGSPVHRCKGPSSEHLMRPNT